MTEANIAPLTAVRAITLVVNPQVVLRGKQVMEDLHEDAEV